MACTPFQIKLFMQDIVVSILTPVYNGQRFIAQTIESVRAQTYSNWDDGSTDNSLTIAHSYSALDKRIKVMQQSNQGSAAARNNALRYAQGRYIAFLDADDLWEPDFLTQQVAFMQQKQATLICAAYKRINEQDNEILSPFTPPAEMRYSDLLKTNPIACLTAMYDTQPYGKFFLNENFRSLRDDYILWLDILKKCHVAYGNPQVVASYRMSQNSITAQKWRMIVPQYRVYRQAEKIGILKSLFYLCCWAFYGIKKYNPLRNPIR